MRLLRQKRGVCGGLGTSTSKVQAQVCEKNHPDVRGTTDALYTRQRSEMMITLPAVSSRECVDVLRRVGFRTVDVNDGVRVMERRDRRVGVPTGEIIEPDALFHVLHDAGLEVTVFLDHLGRLDATG